MLNKAVLIGHLGQAPQLKRTSSGQRYAQLSLATSRPVKDKTTGETRYPTEWHRIVIWSEPLLEVVEKYLQKGSKLYIEGAIATRKWTDDAGVERLVTEIILQGFQGKLVMLDKKQGGVASPESEDGYGVEPEDELV